MKKKLIVGFLLLFGITGFVMAQTIVKGKVIDENNRPMGNAHVEIVEVKAGTLTNQAGQFDLLAGPGSFVLRITSLGYVAFQAEIALIEDQELNLGSIEMQPDMIALEEVNIISSVGEERKTPVALTSVSESEIKNQLGDHPFPEIMKMIPGVYPTRTGGGSGDAEVNIRGFEQEKALNAFNDAFPAQRFGYSR